MAITRFIYPSVNVDELDDDDFCRLAMEADWTARMIYGGGEAEKSKPKGNEIDRFAKGKQVIKRTE